MKSGHAILGEFLLAPDRLYLNHGSYGALPKSVAAEQDRLRAAIERDATTFFQDVYPGAVRDAAAHIARQLGGDANDWVFCENATSAINGILGGLTLRPGDEILTTSHAYGAVLRAMRVWAARRDARCTIAELPAVLESEEQVVEIVCAAFTDRTRLLVIDHITSATAVVLPVRAIAAAARAANIAVLVDGAHAPGQIPLDVLSIGADWYTGNAHKWLFAPKGCGVLWTAPKHHDATRPAVLSHGSETGYCESFDWIGTRDVTPWLCFAAAVAAHARFGGDSLMARNRALADQAALNLAQQLGGTISAPASMRAAMASLALAPAPETAGTAANLRRRLSELAGISVPVSIFENTLWLRISAQIYNEPGDYAALADVWRAMRLV